MTSNKTIYIWDGGVFSPPTKAVGKLAYNMATYISSKDKTRVEYHFVPTNKYYNKPWVRCVDEEDRLHMLDSLVSFVKKTEDVPSNLSFIVNDIEIKLGKTKKSHVETLSVIEKYFKKSQLKNVYIANSIETIIRRVKAFWTNALELLFKCNTICYDIYSEDLIGVNQSDKYIYNSINLRDLLNQANYSFPEPISKYLRVKKLTNDKITAFIKDNKYEKDFEGIKQLIMDRITFLPKHLVPESYKAHAGNRVREELDVYYSSINNIQKMTTPGIEEYITSKKLYEHCKSRYKSKLVSKTKKKSSKKSSRRKIFNRKKQLGKTIRKK